MIFVFLSSEEELGCLPNRMVLHHRSESLFKEVLIQKGLLQKSLLGHASEGPASEGLHSEGPDSERPDLDGPDSEGSHSGGVIQKDFPNRFKPILQWFANQCIWQTPM